MQPKLVDFLLGSWYEYATFRYPKVNHFHQQRTQAGQKLTKRHYRLGMGESMASVHFLARIDAFFWREWWPRTCLLPSHRPIRQKQLKIPISKVSLTEPTNGPTVLLRVWLAKRRTDPHTDQKISFSNASNLAGGSGFSGWNVVGRVDLVYSSWPWMICCWEFLGSLDWHSHSPTPLSLATLPTSPTKPAP